ncbi:uncharacterized protein SPPG_03671 [Spizellomyces punctatus DAOM BR117]|uniref:Vps72/YL1 C-terminal domain-containing protein n=1 Tax=Spizellomyces punctatus (strain DAOM BR117) TaxID=645134 RepID=A0A0L0HLE8_SPIPD|nr:uncharacterized protein SPPG_03671 [Spizellomyces punctatus DAOM BR117]KND01883.1 hypothetical protein SPPG_03671 [Spizellomyces punctatus DAOM BR117]|eukprot:XP_016609922.1 hypothetical protein SPPG_03671 [Spizellomyces punctatus DAOM BR117]
MSLSATRERRANAGNRMHSLVLQQQDSLFEEDVLDDVEEYIVEEQEDVFDEDFGSTDEEDAVDEEAIVHAEEKATRQKRRKVVTSISTRSKRSAGETLRTVSSSLQTSSNAAQSPATPSRETREKKRSAREVLQTPLLRSVRQSNRSSTVASKRQLQQKLLEDQKRRALLPQRPRMVDVEMTQQEKLAEAKETERLNLASLQNIIQMEEENRRKRAQTVAERVGPVIRFRSFRVKLVEEVSSEAKECATSSTGTKDSYEREGDSLDVTGVHITDDNLRGLEDNSDREQLPQHTRMDVGEGPKQPLERFGACNLMIFERFDHDPFEAWADRPQYPVKATCPFTGLPARYRDPRTSIPYATKGAYKTLQRVLNQEYAWSPVLRAYMHAFNAKVPQTVPNKWFESTLGVAVEREEKPKPKKPPAKPDQGHGTDSVFPHNQVSRPSPALGVMSGTQIPVFNPVMSLTPGIPAPGLIPATDHFRRTQLSELSPAAPPVPVTQPSPATGLTSDTHLAKPSPVIVLTSEEPTKGPAYNAAVGQPKPYDSDSGVGDAEVINVDV